MTSCSYTHTHCRLGAGLDQARLGKGAGGIEREGREAGSDGEAERMTVHHFIYGGTVSDTFTLVALHK